MVIKYSTILKKHWEKCTSNLDCSTLLPCAVTALGHAGWGNSPLCQLDECKRKGLFLCCAG